MKKGEAYALGGLIIVALFALIGTIFSSSHGEVVAEAREGITTSSSELSLATDATPQVPVDTRERVQHVPLPEEVKAIYMTSCVVGTPSFRAKLVQLAEDTEVNAIVIDVKDFSGTISFNPGTSSPWYPAWVEAGCGAGDFKEFIATLHKKNIYTIARVTVFQDPLYVSQHPEQGVHRGDGTTIWKDRKGISFVDVAAKPYWDSLIDLSTLIYNLGFDEINYDYVRYPSDGNMTDISFPYSAKGVHGSDKGANLEAFFAYLYEKQSDPERYNSVIHENTGRAVAVPYTSADLFGMTTTALDDMNIGQIIEHAFPYFDFVAPMVYPSHYPKGYIGMNNPNTDPYRVVYHAMNAAVERATATTSIQRALTHTRIGTSTPAVYEKPVYTGDKLRTWIQDFDYGGDYGPTEVRAQIKASNDAGVASWMIWAPSNIYTKEALLE